MRHRVGYLDELSDDAIDALASLRTATGSPPNMIECPRRGGAMRKWGADDAAFPVRDAAYCFNVVGAWDDPADTAQHVGWAHRVYDALEPVARPACTSTS
jgi:hypothetical protein